MGIVIGTNVVAIAVGAAVIDGIDFDISPIVGTNI